MTDADRAITELINSKAELIKAQQQFRTHEQRVMNDPEVYTILLEMGVVRIDYSTLRRRYS